MTVRIGASWPQITDRRPLYRELNVMPRRPRCASAGIDVAAVVPRRPNGGWHLAGRRGSRVPKRTGQSGAETAAQQLCGDQILRYRDWAKQ
jgi:hypothetical protein